MVSDNFTVEEGDVDIQKGQRCEGMIASEFNGGMNTFEKNGSVEFLCRVCPYRKDVVYITPPYAWMERGTFNDVCFEFGKDEIGV